MVVLGFVAALRMQALPKSISAVILSVALLPALLGDATAGYVFRHLPTAFAASSRRPLWLTFSILLFLSVWQYFPLCIYVFWLRLQFLPKSLQVFMVAAKLTVGESVTHVLWPYCRNLAVVVGLFVFVSGFQETARVSIVLHASRGTNTEFYNHFLDRTYREVKGVLPAQARFQLMDFARFTLPFTAGVCLFLVWALRRFGDLPVRGLGSLTSLRLGRVKPSLVDWILLIGILSFSLAPLLPLVRHLATVGTAIPLLLASLPFAAAAAFSILVMSWCFSFSSRICLPELTSDMDLRAMAFLVAVLLIKLVPTSVLVHCAFSWMHALPIPSRQAAWLLWLGCQVVLCLPLIASFLMVNHFEIGRNELTFFRVHRATVGEIAVLSFWRRLRQPYLLAFIFAFSLAWNEHVGPELFSTYDVPSAAYELAKRTEGKGSDAGAAAGLIVPVSVVVAAALLFWGKRVGDAISQREQNA
jgi:hypothetical protein